MTTLFQVAEAPSSASTLVSEELLLAARTRVDELFVSLIDAKNEWQYAVKDQDAKYERVLRIKAEYAEWRRLADKLSAMLDGRDNSEAESTNHGRARQCDGPPAHAAPRKAS